MPVHKEIQKFIIQKLENNEPIRFNDLYEEISQEFSQEIAKIAGLETEENKKFDQATYFFDCINTVKKEKLDRDIDRLTTLFEAESDNQKRKEFAKEMAILLAEKNKLNY
jgi:hypothetical protein